MFAKWIQAMCKSSECIGVIERKGHQSFPSGCPKSFSPQLLVWGFFMIPTLNFFDLIAKGKWFGSGWTNRQGKKNRGFALLYHSIRHQAGQKEQLQPTYLWMSVSQRHDLNLNFRVIESCQTEKCIAMEFAVHGRRELPSPSKKISLAGPKVTILSPALQRFGSGVVF